MFFEHGYARRFGIADERLSEGLGGFRSREQLLTECDVVLLPKPVVEDLMALPRGTTLWGWPHCVQDEELTQVAIDRGLTLIAWEAMHHWTHEGDFSLHVFHRNNELAGYCSVMHAMQLIGTTGAFGQRLRAAVISFGATARGGVTALFALGVHDVDVSTHRSVAAVAEPIAPAHLIHYERDPKHSHRAVALDRFGSGPDELKLFAPGTLFVDVSCDEGMGFEWARPTSFAEPMLSVATGVHYYAVDQSPSHLWNSATWEISEALLPFLASVMSGEESWDANRTIRRAIEIRAGVVQNPKILSFQSRSSSFPREKRDGGPASAPSR